MVSSFGRGAWFGLQIAQRERENGEGDNNSLADLAALIVNSYPRPDSAAVGITG